jgi:hypothetical protein
VGWQSEGEAEAHGAWSRGGRPGPRAVASRGPVRESRPAAPAVLRASEGLLFILSRTLAGDLPFGRSLPSFLSPSPAQSGL